MSSSSSRSSSTDSKKLWSGLGMGAFGAGGGFNKSNLQYSVSSISLGTKKDNSQLNFHFLIVLSRLEVTTQGSMSIWVSLLTFLFHKWIDVISCQWASISPSNSGSRSDDTS